MNRERMLMIAVVGLLMGVGLLTYHACFQEPAVVTGKMFIVVDDNGNRRAMLSMTPEGDVAMALIDQQGNVRASMGLTRDGKPVAFMKDKNGKAIWTAP